MKAKYYVGHNARQFELVKRTTEPTPETETGDPAYAYGYFTGPFRTKRGAEYAVRVWNAGQLGQWNQTVAQCERLALQSQGQTELADAYNTHLMKRLSDMRR